MLATLIEVRFRTFNHVIAHYNNPDINEETRKAHLARGQWGYGQHPPLCQAR
jgi:hypothetical protein